MGWRRKKAPQDGVEKGEGTPGWDGEGRSHPRMGWGREKSPLDGAGQGKDTPEWGRLGIWFLLSETRAEAQEVRKFQESYGAV